MEKFIKGLDDKYIISDEGVVYSLKGRRKELKGKIGRHGYREVLINHNGNRKYFLVHILVGTYFIPNPENKRTINHKNSNKLINRSCNLEWNTDSENLIHARDNGKLSKCKITMDIANKIRGDFGTLRKLAVKYKISSSQIWYIKKNKRWVI